MTSPVVRLLTCDVCSKSIDPEDAKLRGKSLVCVGCIADMLTPAARRQQAPRRARCIECRDTFPPVDLILRGVGLLCRWCDRWLLIDANAARVS